MKCRIHSCLKDFGTRAPRSSRAVLTRCSVRSGSSDPAAFVALCGETPQEPPDYEVQARQRRAYSPSAATSS
jgi:hypothetical protein